MPEFRKSHSNEFGDEDVDISVVMACYTEERLPSIDAAVSSLLLQTLKPRAVVIAVDNSEPLAHLLRKRFDWVTVVLNRSNRGASSTRNRGVEEVATTFTAFLDDDETADPDWLLELTRPFAEPDVVGTGGKYKPTWPTVKPSWFPEEFAWVVGGSYEGLPTVTAPVRNVWSGNMAVRTDAFRKVGGFRTDLSKCGSTSQPEDTDLCIRMAAATGGRWMYVPTATINHIVPRSRASLGFFISRCFAEGRGKAVMVKKLDSVSASAIDTEADYARTAVRLALGRVSSLRWAVKLQGLVMLLGLASAASGYLSSFGVFPVTRAKEVLRRRERVPEHNEVLPNFAEHDEDTKNHAIETPIAPREYTQWYLGRQLEDRRRERQTLRIIDVGCGRGDTVAWLCAQGWDAYGVDISPEYIRRGREYLAREGADPARLQQLNGDFTYPFPDSMFDVVLTDQVIEHVGDLELFASEVARISAPGACGLHIFPAKWVPLEFHLMSPFVHWLPKGPLRRAAVTACLRIGLAAPYFREFSFRDRVEIFSRFSEEETFYRTLRSTIATMQRHGLRSDARLASRDKIAHRFPTAPTAALPLLGWLHRHTWTAILQTHKE